MWPLNACVYVFMLLVVADNTSQCTRMQSQLRRTSFVTPHAGDWRLLSLDESGTCLLRSVGLGFLGFTFGHDEQCLLGRKSAVSL